MRRTVSFLLCLGLASCGTGGPGPVDWTVDDLIVLAEANLVEFGRQVEGDWALAGTGCQIPITIALDGVGILPGFVTAVGAVRALDRDASLTWRRTDPALGGDVYMLTATGANSTILRDRGDDGITWTMPSGGILELRPDRISLTTDQSGFAFDRARLIISLPGASVEMVRCT